MRVCADTVPRIVFGDEDEVGDEAEAGVLV
jgi:hypothetical protein